MRPEEPEMVWGAAGGPVFGPDGHLDEAAAHAFVDGAYPDADAARVVLHLRECVHCAALVAEARGLVAAAAGVLRKLDDGPAAEAGVTSATIRATDLVMRRARPATRGIARDGLRAAAAALIVAGLGGGAYVATRARQARPIPSAPVFAAVDSSAAGTAAMAAPALAAPTIVARPAPRAERPLAGGVPADEPNPKQRAVAEAKRGPVVVDSGTSQLDAVAIASAPSPVPRPLAAPAPALDSRAGAPSGTVRSDRRVRRSAFQLPDVRGCYDVAGAPDTTHEGARGAALPSPIRLGDLGEILTGGSVRGAWALVAADSLRVRWTGAGEVLLQRDGAGWAGNGVRLTPSVDAGRCGAP